jgi:predicted nuclease of predicted toxin-antitoxin system
MTFFLDENFPKSSIKLISDLGHKVIDIRASEKEGADDYEIFDMAQKHGAIFLTTDKDFYHTVPFQYSKHHGVVIIALSQPNRERIIEKLAYFFKFFKIETMDSKVILFRDKTYSVR